MERLLSAASFYSLIFLFIMFTASQLLDKINNHISEIQFTRTPKGLYEPIEYILSLGGKRIRPVLMLMGYNLYREDVASIYDPATAIEVYHNHTLLHDDLMDRSDVRRGKPTVHKVFGRCYVDSGISVYDGLSTGTPERSDGFIQFDYTRNL